MSQNGGVILRLVGGDPADSLLFEELGGIWKLSELIELGLGKERPRLCQLAFWVLRDEAAADFVDTGNILGDLAKGEGLSRHHLIKEGQVVLTGDLAAGAGAAV